jgi:hypothetical protein
LLLLVFLIVFLNVLLIVFLVVDRTLGGRAELESRHEDPR